VIRKSAVRKNHYAKVKKKKKIAKIIALLQILRPFATFT